MLEINFVKNQNKRKNVKKIKFDYKVHELETEMNLLQSLHEV